MPFEYFDIFGKVSASYFVSYCLSVVSITKACRVNAECNTSTLLVIVHVKCPKMVLGKPLPPPHKKTVLYGTYDPNVVGWFQTFINSHLKDIVVSFPCILICENLQGIWEKIFEVFDIVVWGQVRVTIGPLSKPTTNSPESWWKSSMAFLSSGFLSGWQVRAFFL